MSSAESGVSAHSRAGFGQRFREFFARLFSVRHGVPEVAAPLELEQLAHAATEKARSSDTPEAIEHAASIWKMAAEARKNLADASTQANALRQENLKSWAQILVPVISVLTLGVTLLTQVMQQKSAQDAQDDAAWRMAISSFSPQNGGQTKIAGLMAQVRLKPFMKSGRHQQEAAELARLVLPEIADSDTFEDLFNSIDWNDLNQIAQVSRSLAGTRAETWDEISRCDEPIAVPTPSDAAPGRSVTGGAGSPPSSPTQFNPCDQRIPDGTFRGLQGPTIKELLQHQRDKLDSEAAFVCNRLGAIARSSSLTTRNLDLHGVYFYNCDLSGIDWDGANISEASVQFVNLRGARLTNATADGYWDDSNWWDADVVAAPLLHKLMDEYYPGSDNDKNLSPSPSRAYYLQRIGSLCKAAGIQCPEASVKFMDAAPKT